MDHTWISFRFNCLVSTEGEPSNEVHNAFRGSTTPKNWINLSAFNKYVTWASFAPEGLERPSQETQRASTQLKGDPRDCKFSLTDLKYNTGCTKLSQAGLDKLDLVEFCPWKLLKKMLQGPFRWQNDRNPIFYDTYFSSKFEIEMIGSSVIVWL